MTSAIFTQPVTIRAVPLDTPGVSLTANSDDPATLLPRWRNALATTITDCGQSALRALLSQFSHLRVEHWREALAGYPAAAAATALKMSGLKILYVPRRDIVMSARMLHALAGSDSTRATPVLVLQRRNYLDQHVRHLIASPRRPGPDASRRSAIQALMEVLS